MSQTYYLYKPYKKERFCLGNAPWGEFFHPKKELYGLTFTVANDVDWFFEWVLKDIAEFYPDTTTLGELRALAKSIVTWCGDDKIACLELNDFINRYSNGESIVTAYPVTGGVTG